MEIMLNPQKLAAAKKYYLRPIARWAFPPEDSEDISACADRGGLQISRIECAGRESCDNRSLAADAE
jgi:hypothetical protein